MNTTLQQLQQIYLKSVKSFELAFNDYMNNLISKEDYINEFNYRLYAFDKYYHSLGAELENQLDNQTKV